MAHTISPDEEEDSLGEVPLFGDPATPAEIREELKKAHKPDKTTFYNTKESDFWRHRHLPAGSVMCFQDPEKDGDDRPWAAVLVVSTESRDDGVWNHWGRRRQRRRRR